MQANTVSEMYNIEQENSEIFWQCIELVAYFVSILMMESVTKQCERLRYRRPEHPLATCSITSSWSRGVDNYRSYKL